MRKLFSILTASSLLVTSTFSVVACAKKYDFNSNVWVITDGGTINDLSFNQSAWEGASKFVVEQKTGELPENWKDVNWRASYFEPSGHTPSDYKTGYVTAKIAGAKTLVLPGFVHGNTIGWAADLVDNIIYIDGSGQGVHAQMKPDRPLVKNIVGITYQAETSGFLAGIATAIYLNAHQEEYGGNLNIGVYGGMDNPVATSNYLWGFLTASDIFNEIILGDKSQYPNLGKLSETVKQAVLDLRATQNLTANNKAFELKRINKVQKVLEKNESWFSQSFQAGEGKAISDELLSRKASVIFPVAGPQTQDTIDRIQYNKSNAKVVGVDTEQGKIYGENYIITSALKEIVESTYDALNNIYSPVCGYDNNSGGWNNDQVDSTQCWINTDQSSADHPTWTGIETTKSVPKNLVDLIHSSDISSKTVFDEIADILQKLYNGTAGTEKIASELFTQSLTKTYDDQNQLKTWILQKINDAL
ncbi:ribose/galactose ABC transporter substrate-binding protein [Spiroplasma syrphidicola EA-1]|uniref:Ribose/galactose ABC transporter substrate-binding protein n=1 Tax=Spiroplasma syrphidicola EA-1 TaxID=1276229 RepID=R4U524_9MOLU|nr:BMP family ABC transporter substrate-binding protein [Spiroplasma syrphidicola]AGM25638.1 ribose/galactose ABC transporter substrate-binding protein [Spiroplasma syrphidicola EA-1]